MSVTYTSNIETARATGEIAAEIADHAGPALIPQKHGGALLSGGIAGHKGGTGRPREALRGKMRDLLGTALETMRAALLNERTAVEARRAILDDSRVQALPASARAAVEATCAEHLSVSLRPREIAQFAEILARYGVGTQTELEQTKSEVRYVIRLPSRSANGPATPPHNGAVSGSAGLPRLAAGISTSNGVSDDRR